MQEYRLLAADGRPDGRARSEERACRDGRLLSFSAELGSPAPGIALAGRVELDGRLAVRSATVDVDGRVLPLRPEGEELEIDGVPALYGLTTRRLRAAGLRPSQTREVAVLRVRRDLAVERGRARYTWLGGQAWRYESGRSWAWLHVRPEDGVVRTLSGVAELDE